MESRSLKDIRDKSEAYDKALRADDPRFNRSVLVIHIDGSVIFYKSAFLMRAGDGWIVTFTEHHGIHFNHEDELMRHYELVQSHEPIEELIP